MERARMGNGLRLRTATDFAHVRRCGRSYTAERLVVTVARRQSTPETAQLSAVPRVGFSVGKRVGNAVHRNRVRRRLREIMRARLARLAPGWDIVVGARAAAASSPYTVLEHEIEALLARAKVLAPGSEARPL